MSGVQSIVDAAFIISGPYLPQSLASATCRTKRGTRDQRTDPLFRSDGVDIPAALLNQLVQLATSIGLEAESLHLPLSKLVADLGVSVRSYRGLQVIIVRNGQPITLTHLLPMEVNGPAMTSLRVPLSLLSPDHDAGGSVIFYAGTPGAFVDLAADLGFVLKAAVTTSSTHGDQIEAPLDLILDGDLPLSIDASGITGLSELSAINRALGMLIDQGHSADHAREILRRAAAMAGVEAHVYAARMLAR